MTIIKQFLMYVTSMYIGVSEICYHLFNLFKKSKDFFEKKKKDK
jgi:hypothetical protein